MNDQISIKELIWQYVERDFEIPDDIPMPAPSLRHKRKMKKIFALFAANKRKMTVAAGRTFAEAMNYEAKHKLSPKKKIILAVVIVVLLALITGFTVKFFISDGFRGQVFNDNAYIFAVNVEDCPQVIEEPYYLSIVPEGFEIIDVNTNNKRHIVTYKNKSTGNEIVFDQIVKSDFSNHLNTEKYELKNIEINDQKGICLDRGTKYSIIIWDNEKYVLSLTGDLCKDDMLKIAKLNDVKFG